MSDGMPLRTPWNAALAAATLLGYRGTRVDEDTLLARARAATGLHDFGDPAFLVPLRLLLQDFAHHAHADATGRQVFASLVGAALANRLRLVAWPRAYPDLPATPITGPIVIAGLPRTGTTLLQNLLAAVPGLRTLRGWETRLPSAPPGVATPRVLAAHRRRYEADMRFARRVSPRLMASHEFGTDVPEECNPLLQNAFQLLHTGVFTAPTHEAHLYATGFRGAYDMHRPHLAALAYRQPACTWVLKAPAHMAALPELLRAYPDARVVFTRRDAGSVAASTAGLALCLQQLVTPAPDRAAVGARVLPMLARMQDAARAARAQWPASAPRFLDVDYDAIVESPLPTVRAILAHFALPEPPGTADAVLRYLRQARRARSVRARYTLAEFGLDAAQARRALPPLPGAMPAASEHARSA
ncbi:MAG: sulfotransferase [Burkholderiales bacterium]